MREVPRKIDRVRPHPSSLARPSRFGPSTLAVLAILTLGSASHADPPPAPPTQGQLKENSKVAVPPPREAVECQDDSELHRPCDGRFKVSCKKQQGEFSCDNLECTEGTCRLPDE